MVTGISRTVGVAVEAKQVGETPEAKQTTITIIMGRIGNKIVPIGGARIPGSFPSRLGTRDSGDFSPASASTTSLSFPPPACRRMESAPLLQPGSSPFAPFSSQGFHVPIASLLKRNSRAASGNDEEELHRGMMFQSEPGTATSAASSWWRSATPQQSQLSAAMQEEAGTHPAPGGARKGRGPVREGAEEWDNGHSGRTSRTSWSCF